MTYYIKLYLDNGDKVVSNKMNYNEMKIQVKKLKANKDIYDVFKIKGGL